MGEINLQLVREFFELNRFSVLTHWQQAGERGRPGESGALLFAERIGGDERGVAPFLLHGPDVRLLHRVVIEVRAWHADKFYPSVIESSPILAHVASEEVRALAAEVFAAAGHVSLLVLSELPASSANRARSLQRLQELGIDHVLEFGTLLSSLAWQLNSGGNYAPSQTLQTLRLLKRYNLLRRQQLEFVFPGDPPAHEATPVETDLSQRREELPEA